MGWRAVACLVLLAAGPWVFGAPEGRIQGAWVDVRVLAPDWLCIVADPTKEVVAARTARHSAVLQPLLGSGPGPEKWKRELKLKYATLDAVAATRPAWAAALDDVQRYRINGTLPRRVTRYPMAIDGFPAIGSGFPANGDVLTVPRLVDYVYLQLPAPLMEGETVQVTGPHGSARLLFSARQTVCWSIKVNQLGYRPHGPGRTAGIGMWLGPAGPADFTTLIGQPFHIVAVDPAGRCSGAPRWSGTVRAAALQQDSYKGQPISGEAPVELDFGEFHGRGRFCLVVPGLGRSFPFTLADDVYAPAWSAVVSALQRQECGPRRGCHLTTFAGDFVSEADRWYRNPRFDPTGATGFSQQGQPVHVDPFELLRAHEARRPRPEVFGGWHDAADFDRRLSHLNVVWDLCGLHELCPERFNSPELLNLAAVGVDVWMRTQSEAGGVSGWIEQATHPHWTLTAAADRRPAFVCRPDRFTSLQYAAAAANLARLLKRWDAPRAARYLESAERALSYAENPQHRLNLTFKLERRTVTFREPEALPAASLALARLHLDLARKAPLKVSSAAVEALAELLPDQVSPLCLVGLLKSGHEAFEPLRTRLQQYVSALHEGSTALPYHTPWFAPRHSFFPHMAWGRVHGGFHGRMAVMLWRLYGSPEAEALAVHAANSELGCNPLGESRVTGLGSVSPRVVQDHGAINDGRPLPPPGLVPFGLSYGSAWSVWTLQLAQLQSIHPEGRELYHADAVVALPPEWRFCADEVRLTAAARGPDEAARVLRTALADRLPILRRTYRHPYAEPSQNEFTVHESLSPALVLFGSLLPPGAAARPPNSSPATAYPQP